MAFIFLSKKEIKQGRLETMKIVRILDDVDWVYGKKSHVKRHVRSEWAQRALASGEIIPADDGHLPVWLAKRLEALPSNPDAKLCFNFCEYLPEKVDIESDEEGVENGLVRVGSGEVPKVTFEDICKEFGKRKHGVAFSELVRHYIKTKFNNKQSRAASAARLDPQVVNQIYNATYTSKNKKKERGVSQRTVIALALAFELTLDEAEEFMRSAGYAFSDSEDDVLFKLCFRRRFYSISKIDGMLQAMQMKGLGSRIRNA